MHENNSKRNWKLILATYTFVLIGSLIVYGYEFPTSNIRNQIPSVLSLLDPQLYQNDFYIQEMTRFTPRYYYYHLIYFPVKLGLSLPIVCFIYYLFAFCSFVLGLYAIGKLLGKSRLSAAVLAFLGLAATNGTIGGVDLFRTEPIPAIYGMGLTIWGFYFCFRKNWLLGYLFFGIASLLQLLVGVIPGAMFTPALIIDAHKNNNFSTEILSFLTLVGLACLVYLPMKITGNTSSGIIDNAEFVYLYGNIRHPHHVIFSSFSLMNSRGWLNCIFFIMGGLLCIKNSDSLHSEDKIKLSLAIGVSVLLLLLGYIFVEVYPLALFAKLQLARTTPFAQLIILIAISILVNEAYKQDNIPLVILLIIAPIIKGGGILLLVISLVLLLSSLGKELKIINSIPGIVILSAICFITMLYYYEYDGIIQGGIIVYLFILNIRWIEKKDKKELQTQISSNNYLILAGLFVAFMVISSDEDLVLLLILAFPVFKDFLSKNKKGLQKIIIYIVAFISSFVFLLGFVKIAPHNSSNWFQKRIQIYPIAKEELQAIAVNFKQLSEGDALVLVPPSDENFRFYSQRSVVVTFKSFPFTDRGIKEWKNRLEAVLGKLTQQGSLNSRFSQRSSSELVNVARRFGASYLLTRVDWHPDIKGVVVDREGDWIIWKIN